MEPNDSDFSARGPYTVGVAHTIIASPYGAERKNDAQRLLPTEIWYPAEPGQPDLEDAPHPLGVRHRATAGLAPIGTSSALVAFSHGNSGLRQQSTFLTTHLASWGIVVVAPDHVGNTFSEMMALPDEEARRSTHLLIRDQRPHDLHAVVRALLDGGDLADELPPLDPGRLGLLGHSFGGWTALKVAGLEPRVAAICSLAPASEPFVGRKAFLPGELPLPEQAESLVLAARDDVLVDLETSIRPLSDRLGRASRLEVIDRADHFHFCDGIKMLHELHENNPREKQTRPTRSFEELRDERDMHTLLNERVTRFFAESLGLTKTAHHDRGGALPGA
jgi:dienelactone hydrolase